jgi:PLP dependent protein
VTESAPTIATRLADVRGRVDRACEAAGRAPAEVELLAVSKAHPADVVLEAHAAGHTLFGENYVQDWQGKADDPRVAALPGLRWSFVGHLQRNKIKFLLGRVACIETIDRLKLARDVARRAEDAARVQPVLLQVHVGDEPTKSGFDPDELRGRFSELIELPGLRIDGLMAIPPFRTDPEQTRPDHRALRELRDELRDRHDHPLPVLSTGMSADFEVAIQEGSTRVRVGTAIFGARPPRR